MELDSVAVSGDRVGCFMFMVCTVDFEFYGAGERWKLLFAVALFIFFIPFSQFPFS